MVEEARRERRLWPRDVKGDLTETSHENSIVGKRLVVKGKLN